MLGMLIVLNLGQGVRAPMVVDIGGVRQGVRYLLQFPSILNLNFGFPNFWGRCPYEGGHSWCQMERQ